MASSLPSCPLGHLFLFGTLFQSGFYNSLSNRCSFRDNTKGCGFSVTINIAAFHGTNREIHALEKHSVWLNRVSCGFTVSSCALCTEEADFLAFPRCIALARQMQANVLLCLPVHSCVYLISLGFVTTRVSAAKKMERSDITCNSGF